MKEIKKKSDIEKIINSMDLVYEKLIEFKKKNNSYLVVLKDDKIVKIKP